MDACTHARTASRQNTSDTVLVVAGHRNKNKYFSHRNCAA